MCTQSWLTLWDPKNCSPGGSSVHGISQERVLEWVAISFSGDLPFPGVQSTFSTASLLEPKPATCVKPCLHLVALHRTVAENSKTDKRAYSSGFRGAQNVPAVQETQVQSLGWEDPLEKGGQLAPVFFPGESHGQRSWWATVHRVTKSRPWPSD